MSPRKCLSIHMLALIGLLSGAAYAQAPAPAPAPAAASADSEAIQFTPGDEVKMEVYGHPEMTTTVYVESNGTIRLPLVGSVLIGGMSPAEASKRVEKAYSDGYLRQPQVSLVVVRSPSNVSVLGEVKNPNRYPIDGKTTVLDVLAQAGGPSDKGGDFVVLLRKSSSGKMQRARIDLREMSTQNALFTLRPGDVVYLPEASKYFMVGEVRKPDTYRLKSGLTIQQAIAQAGGVTDKGSTSRIEIERLKPNGDYAVVSGRLNDKVEPDDVINIKQRIF